MARVVVITRPCWSGEVWLSFPYDPEAIEALRAIGGCHWNRPERVWQAPLHRRAEIVGAFLALRYLVEDLTGPPAGDPDDEPFERFLRELPDGLRKPAFHALSKTLHPDVGGDLAAMQALTRAWARVEDRER